MKPGASALAGLVLMAVAGSASAAEEGLLKPYTTSECFAFWTLIQKLNGDGVAGLLSQGPTGPGGGLPEAQMERVTLYLDLEEKLRFRCPDFAPPPDRAPGKRPPAKTAAPPVTGSAPPKAPAPASAPAARQPASPAPVPAPARRKPLAPPPAAQPQGVPLPQARPRG